MSAKPYRWYVDGVAVNRAHAFVVGMLSALCSHVHRSDESDDGRWKPDADRLRCGQCMSVLRQSKKSYAEVDA